MAINHLIKACLTCKLERPRLAYVAPTYKQGKAIAWDYAKHYTRVIPGVQYNEAELRVDLPNGARFRIFGADSPDSMRGLALDGVVLDEYGLMQGRVWSEVLRPALADRLGWALFIGTPNGKNAFWEIRDYAATAEGWYLAEHKASETDILLPSELADAKRLMTSDEYAQEFECSFEASVRGAIFAKELEEARNQGRIGNHKMDSAIPVQTAWDLGMGDATAIWFYQVYGSEIRLVDYYEASGEGLQHYISILAARGYVYGRHYAPHDIEVRELGTGKSRREVAASLGINFQMTPKVALEDGINIARMTLPRCYFDAVKCKLGLECLQNYRRDYNQRLDEFKAMPVHDWASHGADAFRYLALCARSHSPAAQINYDNRGIR